MSEAATSRLRLILTRGVVLIKANCEMSEKKQLGVLTPFPESTKEGHEESTNEGDDYAEEKPEKEEKKPRRGSVHAERLKQGFMPTSNNPKREDEKERKSNKGLE